MAAILIPVIGGFISRANRSANLANARNIFNSSAIFLATNTATFANEGAAKDAIVAGITGMVTAAVPVGDIDLEGTDGTKNWVVKSAAYGVTPDKATYFDTGSSSYS